MLLLLGLFLLGESLLHLCALPDFLAGMSICHEQGLGELSKFVVDGDILQTSSICCQPLVEGNGETFGVLDHNLKSVMHETETLYRSGVFSPSSSKREGVSSTSLDLLRSTFVAAILISEAEGWVDPVESSYV